MNFTFRDTFPQVNARHYLKDDLSAWGKPEYLKFLKTWLLFIFPGVHKVSRTTQTRNKLSFRKKTSPDKRFLGRDRGFRSESPKEKQGARSTQGGFLHWQTHFLREKIILVGHQREGRFKMKELLTFCIYICVQCILKVLLHRNIPLWFLIRKSWYYKILWFLEKRTRGIFFFFAAQRRVKIFILSCSYKGPHCLRICWGIEKPLHKSEEWTKRKRMAVSCKTRRECRQKKWISWPIFPFVKYQISKL